MLQFYVAVYCCGLLLRFVVALFVLTYVLFLLFNFIFVLCFYFCFYLLLDIVVGHRM